MNQDISLWCDLIAGEMEAAGGISLGEARSVVEGLFAGGDSWLLQLRETYDVHSANARAIVRERVAAGGFSPH